MDRVQITIDGTLYELEYNEQTESYEITILAPETTGLHLIDIQYLADDGEIFQETADLIVLAVEEVPKISHEIIAFFLDKNTFEIKDVTQIGIESINRDLETNGNSIFISPKKINTEGDDYIYLKKDDELNFIGIVIEQTDSNDAGRYQITCKDIQAMLEFDSFINNEDIIKNIGIEDFIGQRITEEFINNSDSILNKQFFEVDIKTHNPKNISISSLVDVNENIYNFLTFSNNAIQNYELKFNWYVENKKLILEISQREEEKMLIDTTIPDVSNYMETFSLSYAAKVEVYITENSTIYTRYLLSDRSTTTDKDDVNRVAGPTIRKSVTNSDDAEQASLDAFKGNSYNHNITFKIIKNSKLINVKNINLGTPITIKTQNNVITETYISKIVDDASEFIALTCGNLRVDFINKLLKERRS